MPGIAYLALGLADLRHITQCLRLLQQGVGIFGRHKAGTAEHHHRVVDTLGGLVQIGLQHLQLDADAAGFTA